MMLNRHAVTAIGDQLPYGVVALVVLVALLYAATTYGGDVLSLVDVLLPDFGGSDQGVVPQDAALLRMDLNSGDLGWYDGTRWHTGRGAWDVAGGRFFKELGQKRIDYQDFGDALESVYDQRARSAPPVIPLHARFRYDHYSGFAADAVLQAEVQFVKGGQASLLGSDNDVVLYLKNRRNPGEPETFFGWIFLKPDDSLFERKLLRDGCVGRVLDLTCFAKTITPIRLVGISSDLAGSYQKIIAEASVWRESVFDRPVSLPYVDLETGQAVSGKTFCVRKDRQYLVVDLGKEVDPAHGCP